MHWKTRSGSQTLEKLSNNLLEMNTSFRGTEGQGCLGSRIVGRDLSITEDCKLNMTQWCHAVRVRHTRVDASSETES